jgi:uncharacterized protein YjbJ (UPF0337 family)
MNWEQTAAQWSSFSEHIQSRWQRLTEDDLIAIGGSRDALVGKLHERYGLLPYEAERSIDEWLAELERAAASQQSLDSELDQQRSESEGMGQARYGPPPRPANTR